MKINFRNLLIFIGLVFLSACENAPCEDREYQPLNEVVADHIPYTQGQIVKFKTSAGDSFNATAERLREVNRPDAPLICQDYLYVTLKTGGNLFVEYVERGSVEKDSILQVSIYTLRTNSGSGAQIAVSDDGAMRCIFPHTTSVQHAAIDIDGKTYEQVLEINFDVNDIPTDVDLTRLFYNKAYGIIQYTTYSGVTVTLLD